DGISLIIWLLQQHRRGQYHVDDLAPQGSYYPNNSHSAPPGYQDSPTQGVFNEHSAVPPGNGHFPSTAYNPAYVGLSLTQLVPLVAPAPHAPAAVVVWSNQNHPSLAPSSDPTASTSAAQLGHEVAFHQSGYPIPPEDPTASTSAAHFGYTHGDVLTLSSHVDHGIHSHASSSHQGQGSEPRSFLNVPYPPSISSRSAVTKVSKKAVTEPGATRSKKERAHNPLRTRRSTEKSKGKEAEVTSGNPEFKVKAKSSTKDRLLFREYPAGIRKIIDYAKRVFVSDTLFHHLWFYYAGGDQFEGLSDGALSTANSKFKSKLDMDENIRKFITDSSTHQRGALKDLAVDGVFISFLANIVGNSAIVAEVERLCESDPLNPDVPLFAIGENFPDGSPGVWTHALCGEILGQYLLEEEDGLGVLFPRRWGPSMLPIAVAAGFTAIFCGFRHYVDGLPRKRGLKFSRVDYEGHFLKYYKTITEEMKTNPQLGITYGHWWQSALIKYGRVSADVSALDLASLPSGTSEVEIYDPLTMAGWQYGTSDEDKRYFGSSAGDVE
ncbi:hypothetical protein GALMADRAFT_148617, partial [Galerina marginata CBS 339.88]